MDHIVVDVEIQKTIEEAPGGWDATDKLGVACACVWEYEGQRMRIYGPNDVPALQDRLWRADRISGFNIANFDFPCIWGIPRTEWGNAEAPDVILYRDHLLPRTNDILRRIWLTLNLDPDRFDPKTHGGWSLDKIAHTLFGVSKIGHGADAPKWFQAGDWARLANYCADDVALERDLTDFVDRYGFIVSPKTGRLLTVTANWGE